jgi:hypothetical protein
MGAYNTYIGRQMQIFGFECAREGDDIVVTRLE